MNNDSMGDRMKSYEAPYKGLLPRRTYTVIRVDGRAFHTFLKRAQRPFDKLVAHAMDHTALALCKEIPGTVLAYVQSDEISLVITDFQNPNFEPWFASEVQKMASVSASIATAVFNRCYYDPDNMDSGMATFDSRVFTIPQQIEVANYLVWRQQDAVRNAVSMAAQAHFDHRECMGKKGSELQEMLFQRKGINFNDYEVRFKRGGIVIQRAQNEEATFFHPVLQEEVTREFTRNRWTIEEAPHFAVAPGGFLASVLPAPTALVPFEKLGMV